MDASVSKCRDRQAVAPSEQRPHHRGKGGIWCPWLGNSCRGPLTAPGCPTGAGLGAVGERRRCSEMDGLPVRTSDPEPCFSSLWPPLSSAEPWPPQS